MRPGRLDTAAVFERIFAIYRRQAGVLLPAAAIVYLVPSVAGLSRSFGAQVFALAAALIAAVWYQGMVVQAVRDIQDGVRDLSLGALFRSVSPVLAQLLWTAILVGIGFFLGFAVFIIPGLWVLTQWWVAAPVVVIESHSAPRALGRSRELVRGHGWQVFSVMVVTLLIVFLAYRTLIALAVAISDTTVTFVLANLVAGVLTAPIVALSSAVLYLELLTLRGEPLPPAGATS